MSVFTGACTSAHIGGGQKRMLGVLLSHAPPYPFETGSLTELQLFSWAETPSIHLAVMSPQHWGWRHAEVFISFLPFFLPFSLPLSPFPPLLSSFFISFFFLHWSLRFKSRSSCLHSQHPTHCTFFSAPHTKGSLVSCIRLGLPQEARFVKYGALLI